MKGTSDMAHVPSIPFCRQGKSVVNPRSPTDSLTTSACSATVCSLLDDSKSICERSLPCALLSVRSFENPTFVQGGAPPGHSDGTLISAPSQMVKSLYSLVSPSNRAVNVPIWFQSAGVALFPPGTSS